jgi:hypothetical protein
MKLIMLILSIIVIPVIMLLYYYKSKPNILNIDTSQNYTIEENNPNLKNNFNTGIIIQDCNKWMNNCNVDVLYPNEGLGPDYGWKMPENCRCNEFLQPP